MRFYGLIPVLLVASIRLAVANAAGSPASAKFAHLHNCNGYCIDEESTDTAVAVAEATVSLASRGGGPVRVDRWLLSTDVQLASNALGYGACIPDVKGLRRMLKDGGDYLDRDSVARALSKQTYSLLLFFRHGPDGDLQPYCTLELGINWVGQSLYAGRLSWLREKFLGLESCVEGQQVSPADRLRGWDRGAGTCVAGLKAGKWEYRSEGGLREEGLYEEGRRTGLWRTWGADGRIAEQVPYIRGRREGAFVRFFKEKKVEEGDYRLGRRTGVWMAWYENGQTKAKDEYRDGSKYGRSESYWEDGRRICFANYVWGVLEGHLQRWNQAGELMEDGNMTAGKKSGRWLVRKSGEVVTVDLPIVPVRR
jgi:antitoxin component YwqK of YwqJK toxin-antitoxin module